MQLHKLSIEVVLTYCDSFTCNVDDRFAGKVKSSCAKSDRIICLLSRRRGEGSDAKGDSSKLTLQDCKQHNVNQRAGLRAHRWARDTIPLPCLQHSVMRTLPESYMHRI